MNYEELEKRVIYWAELKGILGNRDVKAQAMKFGEESGELFGALLRNDKEKIIDSFGDVLVTLIILAEMTDMDLMFCLAVAYDEIKDRKGKMQDGAFIKEGEC